MFGLSKKAFKRAAGRLLKLGQAHLDADGFSTAGEEALGGHKAHQHIRRAPLVRCCQRVVRDASPSSSPPPVVPP